jgi:hypothetical protein
MSPDDERAFVRFLGRFALELYPLRVPPNWKPPRVDEDVLPEVPPDAAYLAATDCGPVSVDKVKRGPDRGSWRVDEVRSPVIFWERSQRNEEGELLSGKLWAELEITPQTGRRDAAPDRFRRLFLDVEAHLKTYRRSDPKGFWIGPDAARRSKAGEVLRDSEHRGPVIRPK